MFKSKFLRVFFKGLCAPMCLVCAAAGSSGDGGAAGGDEGQQSNEGQQQQGQSNQQNAGKTFTQEDLNRVGAQQKAEGRKAILKELGIEDTEDARAAVKTYLEQQEAQKSDLQKALDAATAAKKEKASAEKTIAQLNQKFDALKAGAKTECVEDLLVITRSKMNDKTDFNAALEATKKAYPMFFNTTENNQNSSRGTGSSINHPNGSGNQMSMGERLAKSRMGNDSTKNPFFKNNF